MMMGSCSDPVGPAEGAGPGAVGRAPAGAPEVPTAGATAEGGVPAVAAAGAIVEATAGAGVSSSMRMGLLLLPSMVESCDRDKRKHSSLLQSYIH
jgi:hypothetical protein